MRPAKRANAPRAAVVRLIQHRRARSRVLRRYFNVTLLVAEPPRLLRTVALPGFDDQLNSPRIEATSTSSSATRRHM